jgi:hypothetical protein
VQTVACLLFFFLPVNVFYRLIRFTELAIYNVLVSSVLSSAILVSKFQCKFCH